MFISVWELKHVKRMSLPICAQLFKALHKCWKILTPFNDLNLQDEASFSWK